MMRSVYGSVLSLYPLRYRDAFGTEMMAIYESAAAERRKRGALSFFAFSAREIAGLAGGIFSEWAAVWFNPHMYVTSRCQSRPATDLPPHILEVQSQLENLIRSMEFAIAHHDFPKARFYSDEERVARASLQMLMREYETGRALEFSSRAPV